MAKDIVQATNNKGVAGWSLKTDDNATVDPTINWQEGQAPSTVNNSARAMMTRIREEHDIVNDQLKVIKNGWGSRFLYVEIGSYTLKDDKDGTFSLNMVISDKLTDEQYTDFKKRKLFLAVNWRGEIANDIVNDPVYKSITTRDIIKLSLSIPTASTTHQWDPFASLNFFGTLVWNYRITLHELAYILNNIMEYVADPSMADRVMTLRSIPMARSYIDLKAVTVKDNNGETLTVAITWYYISPCEIILTVEPKGTTTEKFIGYRSFKYDLGIPLDILTFLDATGQQGGVSINLHKDSPLRFVISSYYIGNEYYDFMPYKWDGIRYRFYAKLTTKAQQDLYPMNTYPEPGLTYPIIT